MARTVAKRYVKGDTLVVTYNEDGTAWGCQMIGKDNTWLRCIDCQWDACPIWHPEVGVEGGDEVPCLQ